MNRNIITTTVIAALLSLVALPAVAGPHHHAHQNHPSKHHGHSKWEQKKYKPHPSQKAHTRYQKPPSRHQVKPRHHWQRGQVLNKAYRGKPYWVDARKHPQLPHSGKHERWVKVDQDYILVNTLSHVIVSILSGR